MPESVHFLSGGLEQGLYNLLMQAPFALCVLEGPRFVVRIANQKQFEIWEKQPAEVLQKSLFDILPEPEQQGLKELLTKVYQQGRAHKETEMPVLLARNGSLERAWFDVACEPLRNDKGGVEGVIMTSSEVTEKVLARKKAEEREQEWRQLANAMPQLVWMADADGTVIYYNEQVKNFAGAVQSADGTWSWQGLLHPDDEQPTTEAWARAITEGTSYQVEHRVKMKDGSYHWHLSRGFPQRNAEGQIVRWYGTATDIQEVKTAEDKIKVNEDRFRRAFANANIGMAITDMEGNYLEANRAYEHLVGYSQEELRGMKTLMLLHPDDREKTMAQIKNLKDGSRKDLVFEKRYIRKNGAVVWVEISASVMSNERGEPHTIIRLAKDITEEKKAKEQLQQSEQQFRSLAENSPDVITRHGKDFRYMYASPGIESFTGLKAQQFAGRSYRELGLPEDLCSFLDAHLSTVFTHKQLHTVEYQMPGDDRHIYVRMVPEVDEKGNVNSVLVIATDVTAQRKTQQALAYQKTLLETVTKNTTLALFMLDNNRNCIYMNEAAEAMTGFRFPELKGKNLHYQIHHSYPDGQPYPLEACPLVCALPNNQQVRGEEIFVHKNGSFYPVAFTASPIVVDGQPIGTVLEVRDTTEEKRKEKLLQETKEQLELTVENVPAALYLFSNKGEMLFANKSGWQELEEVLGENNTGSYSLETLMQKSLQVAVMQSEDGRTLGPEDMPVWVALSTGKAAEAVVKQTLKRNGAVKWVLSKATPLLDKDGRVSIVLAVNIDISPQKVAEEKIRQSEDLFRSFSNNIQNLAWIADGEGWIYWYNQRWYDYTGTSLEEMQGWGWEKVHHPDHLERVVGFVKEAWKRNEPWELIFPLRRHDGVYRWFLTRGVPIKDKEGKVYRWIGTNTDIDKEKKLSEKLEELVHERTLELEQANKELQRSNEDLQQFAHVASHDLKEPVRKVRTFGSRLKDEFKDLLPERALSYLSKMESATVRMYAMIEGVLMYSSVDALQQTTEPVDLNKTLEEIQNDLEVIIAQKKASFEQEPLPVIPGSPILIYQLFYNLINNSLKFSRSGLAPVIKIKAEKPDEAELVKYGLRKDKEYIKVTIRDNGIGFPREEAAKIFGTFTRLHPKDRYEGTGLGLALCKKVVERHRGAIYADGKEGEGAVFTILLPKN